MSTISEMLIKIGADSTDFKKGLDDAQQSLLKTFDINPVTSFTHALTGTSSTIGSLIVKFGGLAALASGGFGLKSLISGAVQAGEGIYQLQNRFKITTAAASEMSRILTMTGSDVDTAGAAIMRLDKNLQSGSKEGAKAAAILKECGVSLTDGSGSLLPLNEQLKQLAAGFQKANAAGASQEFIMGTLGVRGLTLTKTLQNYNEAATAAARVKGIGLDPDEMHKVAIEMQVVEMQANQLKNAGGAALVPLAQDIFPPIISGLTSTARWLQTNRDLVRDVTKTSVEFLAVYKGVQAANAAITMAGNLKNAISGISSTATDIVLTASQEKSILKRERMIEAEAQKEINAYRRSAEYKALTEDQKTAAVTNFCVQAEIRTAEMAAKERAAMTAAFAEINAGAASSTSAVTAANTAAAESANISTAANIRVAESETAKGIAATGAGEKAVVANTSAARSSNMVAVSNVRVGTTATAAGVSTVTAMAKGTTAVGTMGKAVLALMGGWLGVAAAIGYAAYKFAEYKGEKIDAQRNNTYTVNGQDYQEKNGYFYKMKDLDTEDELHFTGIRETEETPVAQDSELRDQLNSQWFDRHKNDDDYVQKLQKEQMDSQMKALNDQMAANLRDITNNTGKAARATKDLEKLYTVEVPLGQEVLDQARKRINTPYELGGAGDDLGNISTDCGKLVLDSFKAAGIQFTSRVVPDMIMEAGSAYHSAASDYIPQTGDAAIVNNGNHIVLVNGQGGYVGANTNGGVQEYASLQHDFGQPSGYISIAELTGGKTITKQITADGKAANEALVQLNKLKTDYVNLQASLNDELNKNSSEYVYGMDQAERQIANHSQQINKLATSGFNVTSLKTELKEYAAILKEQVGDKWTQAWDNMRSETKRILGNVQDDYVAVAEAEYQATITKLDAERKEKLKAVALYKDDMNAQLEVDKWYNANALAAAQAKEDAIREAHNKTINAMADRGDFAGVKKELSANPEARQQDLNLEGNKALAKEYVDLWDRAHQSIQQDIASASHTLYSSLADDLTQFAEGTKSGLDLIKDFAKQVIQVFIELAAQRVAAGIMGTAMGGMGGGGTGMGMSMGMSSGFGGGTGGMSSSGLDGGVVGVALSAMGIKWGAFADGGIATAPTLALIGEAGHNEAVIPLTDRNLSALGSGSNRNGAAPVYNYFQVKDANTFKASQAQICAALAGAVSRGRRGV